MVYTQMRQPQIAVGVLRPASGDLRLAPARFRIDIHREVFIRHGGSLMATLVGREPHTELTAARSVGRLKHPAAAFFALTLTITYGLGLPVAAASHGLLPIRIPAAVGALAIAGPAIAALVLTGFEHGRLGVQRLLSRLLHWRVGAQWYLVALLTPPIIAISALGTYRFLAGVPPRIPAPLPRELAQIGAESPVTYALLAVFFVWG